jgi:DNA-binding transcriptional LysR family regulator
VLDVRRLRVLREVALGGSLTAAARALSFTPSAVSQQLATLEREAGVPLLERVGRGVRLTDAGEALVKRADSILAELSRAEGDLAALKELRGGTLRMASFPTAGTRLVPAAITAFAHRFADVQLELIELEPEASLPQLRNGEVDIVLGYEYDLVPTAQPRGTEKRTLFSEPEYVIFDRGHRHAAKKVIDLATLADEAWIAPTPGTACHDFAVRVCEAAGFQPAIRSFCNDFMTVRALVATGVGIALVPALALDKPEENIVARPLTNRPLRHVFAVWRPDSGRVRLIAGMLGVLDDLAGRFAGENIEPGVTAPRSKAPGSRAAAARPA